ncbi:MAG: hypothetical protein JWQ02_3514 [Capsulimonas sp.]|nr:hypothetical protein [Capsulimonas sp.]
MSMFVLVRPPNLNDQFSPKTGWIHPDKTLLGDYIPDRLLTL